MTGPPDTVLFVSLPAGLGGSARSLCTVLAGLDGRCRRVVARVPGTTVARHLDEAGLVDGTVDLPPPGGERSRLRAVATLARWARAHRHRLLAIHANGLSELVVALPAARWAGVPVVAWIHDWQVTGRQRALLAAASRGQPVRWATVTRANRAALDRAGLAPGAPMRVIPNPIEVPDGTGVTPDPAPASPGEDPAPFTVAYVGAPARYKGFDLLPALVERVAARAPEARWEVWSGPRTADPATFAALEALPQVTLFDKTPDVGAAYRRCDLVCCPSRGESFGRVAAEALAHHRPVVVTDLPALAEVVGDAGLRAPVDDVDALADAMAALGRDPARRAALAHRGPARAAAFSPEVVTAALADLYGLPVGRPRALVVSHEASRTGAPRMAVEVARALADDGWAVSAALRAPGPLRADFEEIADRVWVEPLPRARALARRAARHPRGSGLSPLVHRADEWAAARLQARAAPALVWANTVLAANHVRPARARGARVVLHGHEEGPVVARALARYGLPGAVAGDDGVAWAGAAAGVVADLVGAGTPPDRTVVVPAVVDVAALVERAGSVADAPTTPLVGACGQADERKGADLWVAMAREVHARRPEVAFTWIGPARAEDEARLRRAGLAGVAAFTGEVADPASLLAALDVFVLPSRRDPFPLVVLEAMALSRPVVAFDLPGVRQQLGPAGVLVPPEDPGALAAAVVALLDDHERRRALGAAARHRVARHFDVVQLRPAVRAAVAATGLAAPPGP